MNKSEKYGSYRARCSLLQSELEELKLSGSRESSIAYLLNSAQTMLECASMLIGMHESTELPTSEDPGAAE